MSTQGNRTNVQKVLALLEDGIILQYSNLMNLSNGYNNRKRGEFYGRRKN